MSISDFDVNWFPGHMSKARNKFQQILKFVDFWFEIVDARAPMSTKANGISDVLKNKPRILVLNKSDLSNENETKKWVKYFSPNYLSVLSINSKKSINLNFLNKINLKKKGNFFRALVAGVPNVGKTSFINSICHSKKLKVENRAGVTRDFHWISYKNLEICDTPGILPHKINFPHSKFISYLGLIKSEIVDSEILVLHLICDIYKINNLEGASHKLSDFAKSNGFFLSKGELDLKRASDAFLKRFRDGKFGRVSLEVAN